MMEYNYYVLLLLLLYVQVFVGSSDNKICKLPFNDLPNMKEYLAKNGFSPFSQKPPECLFWRAVESRDPELLKLLCVAFPYGTALSEYFEHKKSFSDKDAQSKYLAEFQKKFIKTESDERFLNKGLQCLALENYLSSYDNNIIAFRELFQRRSLDCKIIEALCFIMGSLHYKPKLIAATNSGDYGQGLIPDGKSYEDLFGCKESLDLCQLLFKWYIQRRLFEFIYDRNDTDFTDDKELGNLISQHGDLIDYDLYDDQGKTPLILAIQQQKATLVKKLVNKYYADVNRLDSHGKSPLYYAIHEKSMPILCILLESKDLYYQWTDQETGNTFFHYFAIHRFSEGFKEFYRKCPDKILIFQRNYKGKKMGEMIEMG